MARLYKIFIDITINGEHTTEPIPCWVNDLDRLHIMLPVKVEFVPKDSIINIEEEHEPRLDPADDRRQL